jgi:hypothetical protein
VVDAFELPIQFEITGGQVYNCKIAPEFCAAFPSFDYKLIKGTIAKT